MSEFIETKQIEMESVTDFITRWRGLSFISLHVPQHSKHDFSIVLMAQIFEGFNRLCTKAHDMSHPKEKKTVQREG